MRVLVISDTHGTLTFAQRVLETRGGITHVIHLGDGMRDMEKLMVQYPDITFFGVKGNNDLSPIYPEQMYIELAGHKIFATHGHLYGVRTSVTRLYEKAHSLGADLVLFGHTHLKYDKSLDGIRFLNPSAFGAILITDNKIEFI